MSAVRTRSGASTHTLTLLDVGEPVGSAIAAAVRVRLTGAGYVVPIDLGDGSAAWTRVQASATHILADKSRWIRFIDTNLAIKHSYSLFRNWNACSCL